MNNESQDTSEELTSWPEHSSLRTETPTMGISSPGDALAIGRAPATSLRRSDGTLDSNLERKARLSNDYLPGECVSIDPAGEYRECVPYDKDASWGFLKPECLAEDEDQFANMRLEGKL